MDQDRRTLLLIVALSPVAALLGCLTHDEVITTVQDLQTDPPQFTGLLGTPLSLWSRVVPGAGAP